jgi:hypothetical protein
MEWSEVYSNNSKLHGLGTRVKTLSAVIGAGVVVTMGALTAAFGGNEAHATNQFGGAGDTTTKSAAPTTVATSVAQPLVKATPFGK